MSTSDPPALPPLLIDRQLFVDEGTDERGAVVLEIPSNQQADDIYELLGRSINQLVKYFDEPEKKVSDSEVLVEEETKSFVFREA